MMLAGSASAQTQQPPAAKPSTAPATSGTKAPAKKTTTATAAKKPTTLTTRKEKFSYALGMSFGGGLSNNLKKQSVEADPSLVIQGFKDGFTGGKTQLTEQEAQAVLQEVQTEVRKAAQEKQEKAAAANKSEGEAFLAANKAKEGVVTTASGLQYKILTQGTGPKPAASDSVVCNYKGTLINGTEFDSSYKRGEPATFPVSGVIKGWTEALQLMQVGSKYQLFIPSNLAYGEQGQPRGGIEPNATLVFEVELVSIAPKDQPGDKKVEDKKPEQKKPEELKPEEKKQ
jgi:FKBP-type peptidyl-prolyl cis-trans isomerase